MTSRPYRHLKPSKTHQFLMDKGINVPTCVNDGCDNLVAVRDKKNSSLKSECTSCISARKKGVHITGVTIHKKDYCENNKCPVSVLYWDGSQSHSSSLHLDHIDGNHMNNKPENVVTFCAVCHAEKTSINNDASNQKPSARINV